MTLIKADLKLFTSFLLMIMLSFLVSCSSKEGSSKKFTLKLSAIQSSTLVGGSFVRAISPTSTITTKLDNNNSAEFPQGVWEFQTVTFSGPGFLQGQTYCGRAQNTKLSASEESISITINQNNCLSGPFPALISALLLKYGTITPPNPDTPFITIWRTDNTGDSGTTQVKLPLVSTGIYNFVVEWGDGTQDTITAWNATAATHTYSAAGTYTVKMTGDFSKFIFNFSGDRQKILDISAWGNNSWTSMAGAFNGCSNLTMSASDNPDLTLVTDMSYMFKDASVFNHNVSGWDTSHVTNMAFMFSYASIFNQDISAWNTSNVTDMSGMFSSATAFNQDIGLWDTSNVTNMDNMFNNMGFNQDISAWNTSNVTNMTSMFALATAFNQNIGSWSTSNVTNMNSMFNGATAFNQNIGGWDTANVTTMFNMFASASSFNQDISSWDTSSVMNMDSMFYAASSFNQDLSPWSVGQGPTHTNFDTNTSSWVSPKPTFAP